MIALCCLLFCHLPPPLECKGIKILLMCKEFSDFFCVKTLWTKLLGIYSVYLNLEFGF